MDSYDEAMAAFEAAEGSDGWLAACEERKVFVTLNREFVAALAAELAGEPEILEIGAGNGELARALQNHGVPVIATDSNPRAGHVRALSAGQALEQFAPRTVLACFPPIDAGMETAVFGTPSVKRFIYIGPEINERVGTDALWNHTGWTARPLPEVDRFLITRLDYLVDFTKATHRRRAGTLSLERETI